MTHTLGFTELLGFDDTAHERRRQVTAICECPTCGEEVAMWSETEEWCKGKDGRWNHLNYDGCSTGECCGKVLIDTFDGSYVLEIPKTTTQ